MTTATTPNRSRGDRFENAMTAAAYGVFLITFVLALHQVWALGAGVVWCAVLAVALLVLSVIPVVVCAMGLGGENPDEWTVQEFLLYVTLMPLIVSAFPILALVVTAIVREAR